MKKLKELDYNKTYYNNKGKAFRIIEELEPSRNKSGRLVRRVKIRFESGYETEVCLSNLYKEPVLLTDNLSPTVYGVGCLGYATYTGNEKMYEIWSGILYRCYHNGSDHYYSYGGKGVTICERWKRFDLFLEDVVNLPGYKDMIDNPHIKYQLDKDMLQQGIPTDQKVYSPTTCMWIPAYDNIIQSHIDSKDKRKSKYYGVQPSNGGNNYVARIKINNKTETIGTYTNESMAARSYDYSAIGCDRPVLNNLPPMSPQEIAKYLARLRNMCSIVESHNNQPISVQNAPLKEMCTIVDISK